MQRGCEQRPRRHKLKRKSEKLVERIQGRGEEAGHRLAAGGGGGGTRRTAGDRTNRSAATAPLPESPTNPSDPACQPRAPSPDDATEPTPSAARRAATCSRRRAREQVHVDARRRPLRRRRQDRPQRRYYGNAAGGFRIKGDYLLNAATRIGAQGYFQFTHFGKGDTDGASRLQTPRHHRPRRRRLQAFLRPQARLCITPLAGVQLAMMSPATTNDAAGSRGVQLRLARRPRGARPAVRARLALSSTCSASRWRQRLLRGVFSEPSDGQSRRRSCGPRQGRRRRLPRCGYTYRFNTPFGCSPFVTLE